MKSKKINIINWEDFFNDIQLKRITQNKKVTYIGTYFDKVTNKEYKAKFELTENAFDVEGNVDEIEYINSFVHEKIADDLFKQINKIGV